MAPTNGFERGKNGNHPTNHSNGQNGNGRHIFSPVQPDSSGEENQFEFDARLLWKTIYRHRYAILGITVVTAVVFGFVASNLDPVYQSEGSILITEAKTYNPPRGDGVSMMLSSMYGIGRENRIVDELQILQSRSLSMEIAEKLLQNPLMENGETYPVLWRNYPNDPATTSRDTVAERIRSNITFSQVEQSNVIKIVYESVSPYEAADMINLTMDTYTDFSTEQNRMLAQSAVQFLDEEQNRIKQNLNDSEQQLQNFMDEEQLVELDAQTNDLIERIAQLETSRQSVRVQLVAADSAIKRYEERLQNLKPQLTQTYSEAVIPRLDRLQYQLAELETKKMLMTLQNPEIENRSDPPAEFLQTQRQITEVRQEIGDLTESLMAGSEPYQEGFGNSGERLAGRIAELQEELMRWRIEKNQYQAQEDVLNEQLNIEQSFFEKLPTNMIELARLRRNVEINEQLYRTVSEQHAEMKLWEQTRFGLGRPVDYGKIPVEPAGTNKLLFILAGLLAGGVMGLGYTCIREITNSKINRVEQIRKLGISVLSLIPDPGRSRTKREHSDHSDKLEVLSNQPSSVAEAFRRLAGNVVHSGEERPQTLMITSYSEGEGEAEVATNFAAALAEMGNRVVVIDTDYRKPSLHTLFDLLPTPGIMDVLTKKCTCEEAVHQTVAPRLDLLTPGGWEPTNPVLVNQSIAFRQLIKRLKTRYHFIVLKSAPLGILADSIPLVELSDGVTIVSRFDQTREDELSQLVNNLERVHAHIMGVVLAGFDFDQSLDYYPGYSRSHNRAFRDYFSANGNGNGAGKTEAKEPCRGIKQAGRSQPDKQT